VLRELSVQNLALIEDARVELKPGFCAWTGETGAGKSLLLTALGLVLGGKASGDLVRGGKTEARAAAAFDLSDPDLRSDVEAILGGTVEEDQLVITRRISSQGRSTAHANGLPVPVGTLRLLGERLIDVHGQHENRALLDPDGQRRALDDHGGIGPLLERYQGARAAHDALRRKRQGLIENAERRRRERDLLAFERDELAAADPKPGEHDELVREAHRLANVGELRAATSEGYELLYEADRSVQGLLERVARRIAPLAGSVPELADPAADLERLAEETREVARTLRRYSQTWEDDPERLEEIEGRLALYRRLAGRFRCDPDDLAARRQAIEDQLAAIARDETDLAGLDAPLAEAWERLKSAAADLSAARRKAARAFARAVQGQLKDLNLADARLTVEVDTEAPGDDPTGAPPPEEGADRVELLFAPNPGEPPRPLRKIASGGELSRVMLAVKTVLAGADRVPTLVFDEIDTGVGGRLGAVLGKKLAALAQHHQIICVTHLPQLASYAAHQWVIRKRSERGRTWTTIEPLGESDRVDELAAMLRGESAAEGTRQEAQAMLAEARHGR
jgi:DNA repair protein RecN (Recombination protein N)